MSKKFKKLVQQRNGFRMNVEKQFSAFETVQKELESAETIENLSVLIEKLKYYNEKLELLNCEILDEISEDDDEAMANEVQKSSELREDMLDVIHRAGACLAKQVSKKLTPSNSDHDEMSVSPMRSTLNLPKLEIEHYSGDPLKWQSFWDSFDSTINSNSELSDIDKFKYLKRYIKGEALNMIEGYRLTASNYNTVVDALKERFGNPEIAIFAHLEKLLALPSSETEYSKLQKTYDDCEKHIRSLVALGLTEDTFGQVFTPIILSKLPRAVRIELHRRNESKPWKLSTLRELMRDEIKAREMGECYLKTEPNKQFKFNPHEARKPQKQHIITQSALSNQSSSKIQCGFCSGQHYADKCTKFRSLHQRKSALNGNCFKCLKGGHNAVSCNREKPCFYCKKTSHHSSLCANEFGSKHDNAHQGGEKSQKKGSKFNQSSSQDTTLLYSGNNVQMQMAVVKVRNGNRTADARVFFDTGSTRSYVKTTLVKKLQLPNLAEEFISVAKFANRKRHTQKYNRSEVPIITVDGDSIPVSALVTDVITCPIQKHPLNVDENPILKELHLADPPISQAEQVEIDILIGADHYYDFIGGQQLKLSGGAVLLQSKLGYIVSGRVHKDEDSQSQPDSDVLLFIQSTTVHQPLDFERFWALEDIGIKDDPYQTDDDKAQEMFNNTVKVEDGRYNVTWPWKDPNCELPTNYGLAFGRLRSLINRFQKTPEILERYDETIKEQQANNIIESVSQQYSEEAEKVHYIPHHCVLRQNKATTKLRIVYDASAKCSATAPSLNECLLRGPVLLHDLCGMLVRFRTAKVALSCDVEKAFLQVGIQKQDRDVTRFLWLKDVNKPLSASNLQVYRFCRVPFGIISSPFLLAATIKHHFEKQNRSKAAKDIVDNIYVDNVLAGRNSYDEAVDFHKEAKRLFGDIGMNIREWYSNNDDFNAGLSDADRGKDTIPKVLGLLWNTKDDTLSCGQIKSENECTTKRQFLQTMAQVYDPCGWFAPVVIKTKMLIQQMWKMAIDWDVRLPQDVIAQFNTLKSELQKISTVAVPRFIDGFCAAETTQYEIHGFCDASAKAYAAVCYVRMLGPNSIPHSSVIFAKARLAPIKPVTIPRLELMAALLAVRMVQFVTKELSIAPRRRFIWSDSKCVLHWLQSSKKLHVFVQNRVKEIKSADNISFRYVPTQCNPADLPSRGVDLSELRDSELWWNGPQYLLLQESYWPETNIDDIIVSSKDQNDVSDETAIISITSNSNQQHGVGKVIDIEKYSSFIKLLGVNAYVQRFITNISRKRNAASIHNGAITRAELWDAEQMWIPQEQSTITPHGLKSAAKTTTVSRLGLIEDDNGIFRCRGRLQNADLPDESKEPVLLQKKSKFSDLIIDHCHLTLLHAGNRQTLAQLRLKYWIPQGMSQVKRVNSHCRVCRRADIGPFRMPNSPPLPVYRVTQSLPLEHTGVDYRGQLYIKPDTNRDNVDAETESSQPLTKVWICLFTCAVVRAIHLEVVTDCTADQFLMCLRRFCASYGKPSSLISDNAKCFKMSENF